MDELKQEIVRTLLYFDIFSHPLRMEEIHSFCRVQTDPSAVAQALDQLLAEKHVYKVQNYYLVQKREDWMKEREDKHKYSLLRMKKAKRMAWIIAQFPFVHGVAISGSLSKYSADNNADIDYFIICQAGRLWISRSALHIFKKLTFIVGMQHYFCMNYFLDYDELELKDKNLYTALESVTLIPAYGSTSFEAFFQKNGWIKEYFPNYDLAGKLKTPLREAKFVVKRFFEMLFYGMWGSFINNGLRLLTVWWWRHKFRWQGFPMRYFDHDFRSTRGESKNHPYDHQRIIMASYWKRVRRFEERVSSRAV